MANKMTAQKVWEKHMKLFDNCDKSKVRGWNDEEHDGFWWTTDGITIYFVGGGERLVCVDPDKTYLPKIGEALADINYLGVLVEKQIRGETNDGSKVRKLVAVGETNYCPRYIDCYVDEKLMRGLPKNALLYIGAYTLPVYVALDAAGFPPVKMIMPAGIRTSFIADEGEEI